MLSAFKNCFKIPELRARILFTLGMIFICRLVAHVTTPGVDTKALQQIVADMSQQAGGGMLGLLDMFSGGALSNCAVGALGIMPYISASIILQLMGAVVPALGRLKLEGDAGRQKLTQYTRMLTVLLCMIQAWFIALTLESPSLLGLPEGTRLVLFPGIGFKLMTVITMTTGTMFIMWLGEQITQRGIGNGISLIITEGIVSRLPAAVVYTVKMFSATPEGGRQFSPFFLVVLLLALFGVVAGTILLTQGQRKIPIQYAKRVVGRKTYGGQSTFMPLRINFSGVMPIIFAQSIIMFPQVLLRRIDSEFAQHLANMLQMDTMLYMLLYGVMILFFAYFWVATQFNPVQIADDLKKYGGYVPGVRPGGPTAEFLDMTMTKITLAGAVFLTIIAVIPSVMNSKFNVPWLVSSFFGGTSLLITVGVMLDTMRQVESHLLMRHYDGFLHRGKLRGRR